ncbi:MAG: FAD-binding oxidoreductase [Arhodomonas sp.]|nr:FAD-binding oxidoreductase [Arhodomonas sp.]
MALLHTVLSGHYAASAPLLAGFWIAATALAGLTLVRAYLLKPLWLQRRPWRVGSIRPLAQGIHELRLEPDGHDGLAYQPGQFVWLRLTGHSFGLTEHPFSIASCPDDGPALRFLIKENGDFTSHIDALPQGRRAFVDGPYGNFGHPIHDPHADGFLLVAGGVGLAPVISLTPWPRCRGREQARPPGGGQRQPG